MRRSLTGEELFAECISQDTKALPSFYRSSAFLRDPELVAIVVRLLSSLSGHVKISLPLNVPALNVWQKQPLLLSGFWKEENDEDVGPVMRGVDVDDYFISDDASPSGKGSAGKSSSHRLPIARDRGSEEGHQDFGLSKSIAQEIEQALEVSSLGGIVVRVRFDARTSVSTLLSRWILDRSVLLTRLR